MKKKFTIPIFLSLIGLNSHLMADEFVRGGRSIHVSEEYMRLLLGPPSHSETQDIPLPPYEVSDVDTGVCITSLNMNKTYDYESLEGFDEELSCKKRKTLTHALGTTAVILRGQGHLCSLFPHPGAKVGAQIFNISGYLIGSLSFFISLSDCETDEESKIRTLESACMELRKQGVSCAGVGSHF